MTETARSRNGAKKSAKGVTIERIYTTPGCLLYTSPSPRD